VSPCLSGRAKSGWAIESRVYAEDPFRDFLPSAGRLVRYLPPAENESVRIDTGVREGSEVSLYYDPLMAKVIAHGVSRAEAIQHMRTALAEFYIKGVSHNMSFLSALVAHPRFLEGRLSTAFIAEEYPNGFHAEEVAPADVALLVAVAAAVHHQSAERATRLAGRTRGLEIQAARDWVVLLGEDEYAVVVQADGAVHRVILDGESFEVHSDWRPGRPLFRGTFNGVPVCLQVEPEGIGYRISHGGSRVLAKVLTPRAAELYRLTPHKPPADLSPFLLSPMPGLLLRVSVKVGDQVRAGEELAIIEAMKMENVLRAARDGKVKSVLAQPIASLAADQPILEFE
jgi:propionyl-CoA carboxylase alpha chain